MFAYTKDFIARAEKAAVQVDGLKKALAELRNLPLDDFGELIIQMPFAETPYLSAVLPAMASTEVQRNWTGNSGIDLLRQTNTFVRLVSLNFQELTRRPLRSSRILDFGCGYGRILRSMYYFVDPEYVYGCDPWHRSIELCKEAGIPSPLAQSDYLPEGLPFEGTFDLIYAFSVFTHLSKRATIAAINVLEKQLSEKGVMVITVRPVEYWFVDKKIPPNIKNTMVENHNGSGFSFLPHNREAVDGDITYGDTSMTLEFITNTFPQLDIKKIERTLDDPYQIVLFLCKN